MTREQYNYTFARNAFEVVEQFDSEEEAMKFFETIKNDFRYCDVEILKGKELWVNFSKLTRWTEDGWKVCYNKVPLMRRLMMAVNA